ncbi:MAG TPA: hypothetical protein VHD35_01595 [Chitinophagaceae bacterium]|nr:hypothetical protein [Chitinophagaceae bacterium]
MSKPSILLLIALQASLFTIFGFILKNMDDNLGNKLLWIGVLTLSLLSLRVFIKLLFKRADS